MSTEMMSTEAQRKYKSPLAPEIMFQIMQELIPKDPDAHPDFCTATCLALTCRTAWAIFRSYYKGPVSLYVQVPGQSWEWPINPSSRKSLIHLIYPSLKEKYRLPEVILLPLLNRDVYGNESVTRWRKDENTLENSLKTRHDACASIRDENRKRFLPSPTNMGNDWYRAAAIVYRKKLAECWNVARHEPYGHVAYGEHSKPWIMCNNHCMARDNGDWVKFGVFPRSCLGEWANSQVEEEWLLALRQEYSWDKWEPIKTPETVTYYLKLLNRILD
jgi:hypothetical protein